MAPLSERIEFTGHDGKSRLAARFDRPAGPVRAVALFAHCFTCSKDVFAASRISGALAERGIATLRFDFTGLGASEGEFANTNFSSNIGDLIAAAAHLAAQEQAPGILIGHSLGGSAVLAAAQSIPSAKAVATIGAPADPTHVAHLFKGSAAEIAAAGKAEVEIAGRRFTVSKQFLDDLASHSLETAVAGLRRALLIFHAPRDGIVGIENASRLFTAAKHPKSFVSLDDADHLLTRKADALWVADVLAAWAGRYISAPAQTSEETAAVPEGFDVLVAETGASKFAQTVVAGNHVFAADEPERLGGTDSGPGPYDLLLAALGACTSMTLRLYAERKGWPVDRIAVALRHGRVHAEDCAGAEDKDCRVEQIEREIELRGALDGEQRARMLEIANKCPVHRTLTGDLRIETHLKG